MRLYLSCEGCGCGCGSAVAALVRPVAVAGKATVEVLVLLRRAEKCCCGSAVAALVCPVAVSGKEGDSGCSSGGGGIGVVGAGGEMLLWQFSCSTGAYSQK